jgi:hypothetical protein
MADDLLEFLNARLGEDERTALALGRGSWEVRERYDVWLPGTQMRPLVETREESVAAHIARHDPARALREVEAARAVVAAYEKSVRMVGESLSVSNRRLVLAFAAVYGGHPDYRSKWKP